MADKHHDELHVDKTTPQGTQEAGVDHGHENRDVKMRPLMGWFGGLAVLMIVVFLSMWGLFGILASYESSRDVLPSPLFTTRQPIPAGQPLLLPNLAQKPNDPHTPWEVGQVERDRENEKLVGVGLASRVNPDKGEESRPNTPQGETAIAEDGSYLPALPANAESLVAADQPATGADIRNTTKANLPKTANGVNSEMPGLDQRAADSSGGLRSEGKHR